MTSEASESGTQWYTLKEAARQRIKSTRTAMEKAMTGTLRESTDRLAPALNLPLTPLPTTAIDVAGEPVILHRLFLPANFEELRYESDTPERFVPGSETFVGFSQLRSLVGEKDPSVDGISLLSIHHLTEADIDTIVATYKAASSQDAADDGPTYTQHLLHELTTGINRLREAGHEEMKSIDEDEYRKTLTVAPPKEK